MHVPAVLRKWPLKRLFWWSDLRHLEVSDYNFVNVAICVDTLFWRTSAADIMKAGLVVAAVHVTKAVAAVAFLVSGER